MESALLCLRPLKRRSFGARHAWADVEADEVDLGKEIDMNKKAVKWEPWGGIVERGHPKSLDLSCLNPKTTAVRFPVLFGNGTGSPWQSATSAIA